MRQIFRFFFSPKTFFNQLQWSRAHWFILGGFALMAIIETQTGSHSQLNWVGGMLLTKHVGLTGDLAIWAFAGIKLAMLVLGAHLLSHMVWWLGGFLGKRGSRRVLERRLAVVLTVFLVALNIRHLAHVHEWMVILSSAMSVWACFLGFCALQEQFGLGSFETVVMAAIVALTLSYSFRLSDDVAKVVADANGIHATSSGLAKQPVKQHRRHR